MKVVVIIPAAGLGTRMQPIHSGLQGSARPAPSKQFAELGGIPILIRTLREFAALEAVSEVWIALREAEIVAFRERLENQSDLNARALFQKKVRLVAGGEHRQQSVHCALKAASAADDDIILVHDAVRPFVTSSIIQEVIAAAQEHGAAIAGLPAVDTVKQVERTAHGAIIKATIPRANIVLAQTPQGFRYGILKKAFDDAAADGFLGTDESSLVERCGQEVSVVMGSPRNIKITAPADMQLAEFYLKNPSH